MNDYEDFIEHKRIKTKFFGHEDHNLNPHLRDFQRHQVEWACKLGRAALFDDTGLGKTIMQLSWADSVCKHTNSNVLIFAPLMVTGQTVKEGVKFGIDLTYCRSQSDVKPGITITNYEMLEHFDLSKFVGVVLDESGILKSYTGKFKRAIISACQVVNYRLSCSATPAPNDYLELGNQCEFLGIMPSNEMIMRFFQNNTMEAGGYELKAHAAGEFWKWMSTWAMCVSNPSDLGYNGDEFVLPELKQKFIEISTEDLPVEDGQLFRDVTINATSIHREGRLTMVKRSEKCADLANNSSESWLIWCNTNYEADELKKVINDSIDLRGSDSPETKQHKINGFLDGSIRVLITKPSIAGQGMNLQHCHNMAFVGLSFSYEDYYQAVRRCWRFGQTKTVNCFIMTSDSERSILQNITKKEDKHKIMKAEMVKAISNAHLANDAINNSPYFGVEKGTNWELHHGDCVHACNKLEDESVGFSVYSPPFSNLYIYSDSEFDMGNSTDDGQFMEHYGYLVEDLYRATKSGRLTAIHCKDLPMYKGRDGFAGLKDFPGEIIKLYESKGWRFHSRVTIWKDPVIEMQRTKNHGLLYKQLCKDSAASRQGMADYMIIMRKWGDEDKWDSVTRNGERFFDYIGSTCQSPAKKDIRARDEEERIRLYSINVWQRYASPVWFDIDQTNVLNYRLARENNEERHICPLQMGIIDRSIELWSNPGDVVFSPFAGIGSEGVGALKADRKFIGAELKKSYFDIAVKNLNEANIKNLELF